MKKVTIIITIIFSIISFSYATNTSKKNIDDAVRMYQNKNYYDAFTKLEETFNLNNIQNDPYSSIALFMIIKCQYKLNNYNSALTLSRKFGEYFPTSRYLADIYFIKSQSLVNRNSYSTAILPAIEAESLTDELNFANDIKKFIKKISNAFLSEDDLERILSLTKTKIQYVFVKLLLIEKFINNGNFEKAKKTIEETEKEIDQIDYFSKTYLKDLKNNLTNSNTDEINIGVVLPLSGANSIPGNNILDGIKLALNKYKEQISTEINLIILDTESDIKKALKYTYQLSQMKNCIAVIGPLSSQSAIAMSPICNIMKLPMLTPTATENGLGNMGEYIFQLSPDQDERGYAIADYSINELNLSDFITIAPGDEYGRAMINSFNKTVEKKEGKIIENIWYHGTPKDIRDEFDRIIEVDSLTYNFVSNDTILVDSLKKLIIKKDSLFITINDSSFMVENDLFLTDSILNINSIDSLEKYFSYDDSVFTYFHFIDSIKNIIRSNPKNDNILSIIGKTGIYLAIPPEDIQYVAPQIAKYNFKAQYIGDANWFDTDILNKYGNYVNDIIFVSDHLWLKGNKENDKLLEEYKKINGKSPTRVGLYGYDTMLLLLNLIESGNRNKEEIKNSLSDLDIFIGPIRKISFTSRKPRVNTTMNFLHFKNNRIIVLKRE
ncbi:MAG: penicillin-binding protein activator [Candidatus Marinimicrobia bacterium]|jgi:ABC-type branched-subunit amino acid transport system substrate-binding protein|nr:penicillin-binding protein activator [Candidatus Neomarinimicrobiota bacterium]